MTNCRTLGGSVPQHRAARQGVRIGSKTAVETWSSFPQQEWCVTCCGETSSRREHAVAHACNKWQRGDVNDWCRRWSCQGSSVYAGLVNSSRSPTSTATPSMHSRRPSEMPPIDRRPVHTAVTDPESSLIVTTSDGCLLVGRERIRITWPATITRRRGRASQIGTAPSLGLRGVATAALGCRRDKNDMVRRPGSGELRPRRHR